MPRTIRAVAKRKKLMSHFSRKTKIEYDWSNAAQQLTQCTAWGKRALIAVCVSIPSFIVGPVAYDAVCKLPVDTQTMAHMPVGLVSQVAGPALFAWAISSGAVVVGVVGMAASFAKAVIAARKPVQVPKPSCPAL